MGRESAIFSHCLTKYPIALMYARSFLPLFVNNSHWKRSCAKFFESVFNMFTRSFLVIMFTRWRKIYFHWLGYIMTHVSQFFPENLLIIFQNPLANKNGITFSFGTYLRIFRPTPIMPPKKRLLPLGGETIRAFFGSKKCYTNTFKCYTNLILHSSTALPFSCTLHLILLRLLQINNI